MFPASTYSDLFDRLAKAGFEDGPGQRHKAHMLLMELSGQLPGDQERASSALSDYLRPLFLREESKAALFVSAFDAWAATAWNAHLGTTPNEIKRPRVPKPEREQPPEPPPEKIRWWQRIDWRDARVWSNGLVAAGLFVAIGYVISQSSLFQPEVPIEATDPVIVDTGPVETPRGEEFVDVPEDVFEVPAGRAVTRSQQLNDVIDTILLVVSQSHAAPTFREFHDAGLFGDLSADEAAAIMGLPVDAPLGISEGLLEKIALVSLKEIYASDYANYIGQLDGLHSNWAQPGEREILAEATNWLPATTPEGRAQLEEFETVLDTRDVLLKLARPWLPGDSLQQAGGSVWSANFSPDGTRIVAASAGLSVWSQAEDGSWDEVELEGHTDILWSAVFSSDGTEILSASVDGTARIWRQIEDGSWVSEVLEGHTDAVRDAAISNDGTLIVTGSEDRTARVWRRQETGSWEQVGALEGHGNWINAVAISPDGKPDCHCIH